MRFVVPALAAALLALGAWSSAAARGYERGKADAQNALRVAGVVVVKPDGACTLFEPGQQARFAGPATGHMVVLVRAAQ